MTKALVKLQTRLHHMNGDAFIDYCKARVGVHSPATKGVQRKLEKQQF